MEMLAGNETIRPTTQLIMFEPYVKHHYISTSEIMRIEVLGNTATVHLRTADEYGMNRSIKLDTDEVFWRSLDKITNRLATTSKDYAGETK